MIMQWNPGAHSPTTHHQHQFTVSITVVIKTSVKISWAVDFLKFILNLIPNIKQGQMNISLDLHVDSEYSDKFTTEQLIDGCTLRM